MKTNDNLTPPDPTAISALLQQFGAVTPLKFRDQSEAINYIKHSTKHHLDEAEPDVTFTSVMHACAVILHARGAIPPAGIGGVTKRQRKVLLFLRDYIQRTGYSPSYDEITAGLGVKSKGGVHQVVASLVARGLITKTQSSRSISITAKGMGIKGE